MKKILSLLFLAALTVGLLGSCSKINERIDGLDKRINNLENDKIASVEQQIAAINQSIADLGTIRTNIQTLIEAKAAQGEDIAKLKAANQNLEGKIAELKAFLDTDLAKFATTEWVNATFATLEKQAEIIADVTKLKQDLAGLDAELDQAIEDLDSSLKAWVNEQLSAYSTTAQMEAKIKALQDQIDALKADNETNKSDIEELEAGLAELVEDLASAKAAIKTAYEKAIEDALKSNNGYITEKIKRAISSANGSISSLSGRVGTLESQVEALKGMIQSVTIIPAYSDGSVEADEDGELTINCIISPASAVTGLSIDNFKVLLNEVKTKAGAYITLNANSFQTIDADAGEVKITADISAYTILDNGKALTAAVKVEKGVSKFTTKFVGITCGVTVVQTVPSSATAFTLADSKKVRLIIEPRTTNLTLEYDGTSHYPENLEVQIKNEGTMSATLSGELPYTHVDFTSGHIDHTSLTTSSSTLAVVTPATIGTLEVKGGNVVIKGAEVTTIEVDENAVADPVTKAPVQIVVEKSDAQSFTAPAITANANVIVAPAADVTVKVDAAANVQVANEGAGTVNNSNDQPITTKAAAQIGEATYITLSDAIEKVMEGQTIEILNDITLDSPITISKSDITIDGKGKSIAVSEVTYWNQYKVGGEKQGLGNCNMISISADNFTLKNVILDGKECRGVSLCTTTGGKNVLYQNVTYTGRGSGHYYGEATGLVTFDGCKFDIHGYAIHFGGESSLDDDVVIKNCEVNGWSSFGACKSLTISDSHFGGANDEGKNGWLAVLRPYCPTTITDCTFSNIYLHEAEAGYECIGLGTGAAMTVILKNCKVVDDSKKATDDEIYSIVRDNAFDNDAAQNGSVFAFDAEGNATDGFKSGTFYAQNSANIKLQKGYACYAIEGKQNIYIIREVEAVAKIGSVKYETLDAAFAAVQAGQTIEIVKAGTYTLPSPISNITIKGMDGVEFNAIKAYGQSVSLLHDVKFESVKFIFGSSHYTGFQHSESVKFTKCTFEGYFNSYGTMLFDQCTFNSPEGNYSMWCYAGDVTYRNCIINCKGKFVNVYNEGNTTADRPWKVVAEGCTFNSTSKNKAAFNIKATCGSTPLYYDVEIKNCTANGENWPTASTSESLVVGSALWQVDDIKAGVASKIKVSVDDTVVYTSPAIQ